MANKNTEAKDLILGIVIGAVASVSTYCLIQAMKPRKHPFLHKVGRTISELGDALQHTEIENFSDIKEEVQ